MIKQNLVQIFAGSTVLLCIVVPAVLWTVFSVKAGKMEEFPGSLTGFMAAANAITLGLLGLQQFSAKSVTSPVP